jgi:hypothetical protein
MTTLEEDHLVISVGDHRVALVDEEALVASVIEADEEDSLTEGALVDMVADQVDSTTEEAQVVSADEAVDSVAAHQEASADEAVVVIEADTANEIPRVFNDQHGLYACVY